MKTNNKTDEIISKEDDNKSTKPKNPEKEEKQNPKNRKIYNSQFMGQLMALYIVITPIFIFTLMLASNDNRQLFKLDEYTIFIINQAINTAAVLTIPFIFGVIGAFTRVLIASINMLQQLPLIAASGLMATFSWLGIKSKAFLFILTSNIEKQGVDTNTALSSQHDFYTMALVAALVGMFSTNMYLFINQKIERITRQSNTNIPH